MNIFSLTDAKNLNIAVLKSQLVNAQGLEILLDSLIKSISKSNDAGEICEILEETANVYLNIAEEISSLRAQPIEEIRDAGETGT
jgi:hypothetical protein